METLFKWLSLLADSLNEELCLLDGNEPCFIRREDLDVFLVPRVCCCECPKSSCCGASSLLSIGVRIIDKAAVFNFREQISEKNKDALLNLFSLTVFLVKAYLRNRGQQERMEFLETALFFLASRFFNGFYLRDSKGAFSLLTGEFPLSFYEDLELKRQKLDMEEGNL